MGVHRHNQPKLGRMIRTLFAAVVLLHAVVPTMSPAEAATADADQSQHAGHDMSGMSGMSDMSDMPEHPATDCCDSGPMDCPCGCVVSQPGAAHFVATIRAHAGAPEVAVISISRHPFNPVTSPFRPPA